VYSSLCYKHLTTTGTHVPYGITQYYLPPGRGDTVITECISLIALYGRLVIDYNLL